MACRNCKYFDENEKSGSKGYCSWYKAYYYDDDNCSHYVKRDSASSSGGCFFTEACCTYLGKPDNCHELTVLRKYRDGYLKNIDGGKEMIDEYYKIAPLIVEKINKSNQTDHTYNEIYNTVSRCVGFIEKGKNENALEEYKNMVFTLKEKFN